jgi:hypothetical protein
MLKFLNKKLIILNTSFAVILYVTKWADVKGRLLRRTIRKKYSVTEV